jgi:hypothetical protein
MRWTAVPFGRYKGKTLPEILLRDLDWFFWVLPKLYGRLAHEAEDLAGKARAIKIPNPHGKQLVVEYQYEHGDRFSGFMFVDPRVGTTPNGQFGCHTSIYVGLVVENMTNAPAAS